MIFTPYPDEALIINKIRKIRNDEYVLLRLTPTMIEKNNLDANKLFRNMLYNRKIVDYETLKNGGKNGINFKAVLILHNQIMPIKMKFYRVKNSRGDSRFSIQKLKQKSQNGILNSGDLLYISTYIDSNNNPQIYIINLTQNIPSEDDIKLVVDLDPITQKFNDIKPRLKQIIEEGYHNNSKGIGEFDPKDAGDTLESLLKITTNNRSSADLDGLIELKTKISLTLDTLFTLRPSFDGTEIATFEKNDRSRVSAFTRLYGYDSEKHPKCSSLYITIGSEDYPQNNQGFYLKVDDANSKVSLMHINPKTGEKKETAFWSFIDLKKKLLKKHPATLWFSAISRKQNNMIQFKYTDIEFSRAPQFMTFLSLIERGIITYDWRGYTSKKGKYSGKNHGNAWRIKPAYKTELFGETEKIEL